jgi:predicted aconitase with swiveling domain
MRIPVRIIVDGDCRAPALLIDSKISFYGEIDPETGIHRGIGETVSGRALIFKGGRGSTVGSYIIYGLARKGLAPACMIVREAEPIIIVGSVLAGIPLFEARGNYNVLRRSIRSGKTIITHKAGGAYVEAEG